MKELNELDDVAVFLFAEARKFDEIAAALAILNDTPTELMARLLEALRPLTAKPLIVKLTPNVADPAAVAAGGERGGADAISLINTLKGTALDPATGEHALGNGYGGLSGPAVKPVAAYP